MVVLVIMMVVMLLMVVVMVVILMMVVAMVMAGLRGHPLRCTGAALPLQRVRPQSTIAPTTGGL